MDILDESFGGDEPTPPLESLVNIAPEPVTGFPKGAVRNRAATTAILTSEPDKMVEKYRLMMLEGSQGEDVTHQQAMEQLGERNKSKSMQHVIGILGDTSIPLEQKKGLMDFVQKNQFKEDPAITLQTQALIADNEGEDLRGEAARISTADVMNEMALERQNRQKLVNGFLATLPDASISTVGEMAAAEVLPFGRNMIAANVADKVGPPVGLGQWVKNFLLPGSTKADLQAKLNSIPPQDREAYTKSLLSAVKEGASVFHNENYFAQYSTAVSLLENPQASKTAEWTENAMTLLDALWVGSEFRAVKTALSGSKVASDFASRARRPGSGSPGVSDAEYVEKAKWELVDPPYNPNQIPSGTKRLAAPEKMVDDIKRLEVNAVVRREHAVTPYNVVEQVNPAQARAMHSEILASTDNEVAEALTGVSREQALINNTFPQAGTPSGNVLYKVNQDVKDALTNTGATRYTAGEFEQAVASVQRDFRNASGLEINDTMTTFRVDGDHIAIDAHYATSGGAFTTAEGARAQAQFALRDYGIRPDEIVIMKRQGMDYVPVKESEFTITPDGDGFVAYDKSGKRIGDLYPVDGPDLDGKMMVSNTEVDAAWRGKGVGGSLYESFSKKYNGQIKPGYTSADAWKVWLNKFPEQSITHIRDEATKVVKRGATPDELANEMAQFEGQSKKYFKEAVDTIRSGGEWTGDSVRKAARPPTPRDSSPLPEGDYIIKVKTLHPVDDTRVDNWNPLDVKRNWTDRIAQTGSENRGALSGWIMDPGSMLHPTLTGSASIVADQAINFENILLKPIKQLRNEIQGFKPDRLAKLDEYIKEANTNGIKFDRLALFNRGFNSAEVESLAKWKDIWDGHYYLENFDMVRTLNSQGYQLFENANTRLFGKPIQKNQNVGRVYDPATDKVVATTKSDLDSLYNQNGTLVALRRPVDIAGETVEHMIVRNTPTEYMRGIRDTDTILNYRDGYYTVNYKAPKFVDEITVANGKETRRTVAVAGNTADAEMFINSQTQASGNRHVMREDSRGFKKDGDGYWDVNESVGRIAQRMRGKPLTQATGLNNLGAGGFIENPMESAVRAAKSLAGRTVSRPMLETAKKRFLDQYKDFLPSDNMGGVRWPTSRNEIVDHGSHTSSKVADARTTYGYINFLEDGYINSADEIFKGGMNTIADFLGKYHLSTGERAARKVGEFAPTQVAKGTVFQAYIAMSNPIRQWIVQSHQAGRMVAYNPVGFLNGGWQVRVAGYLQISGGIPGASKLADDFTKFVNDSGMVAGVDRNSLVRGLGLSMADSSSRVKRGIGAVASIPQTVGFDVGEKVNQLGHLAAVHEKWTRAGKDLTDKTLRDLALTEARALSYDLNKAGELTYTQSTPAMVLQFLQMPQKAMLQATNRKLPMSVRLRLQAWDLVMWGAPTGTIAALVTAAGGNGGDILPDDPKLREMFVDGLEAYYLNQMFSQMFDEGDEKTKIDLSALSPNNMDGWARMFGAMWEDGVFGALAASPAGQLIAVDGTNNSRRNGRIPQAILTMGRFFNVVEEVDPQSPTEFTSVLKDVAKITSAWSAADNAMLLMETRKKQDSMGVVVDSSITDTEIGAAFLGFGTKSTKELYEISKHRAKDKKKHEEEVMRKYREIVSYYKQALDQENPDIEHIQRVTSLLMSTFQDEYDLNLVRSQWAKDSVGKEAALFKSMLDASGMPNADKMADDIRMWPTDDATKDMMLQRIRDAKAMREAN